MHSIHCVATYKCKRNDYQEHTRMSQGIGERLRETVMTSHRHRVAMGRQQTRLHNVMTSDDGGRHDAMTSDTPEHVITLELTIGGQIAAS
ncbi:hypothetical protein FKM82_009874 [Ascaphus truei]